MDKHIFTFIFLIISFISTGQQSFQKEGKYGFVSNGQVIIEATYDYASDFSRGLACVKLNGKWGYINASDEFVIEPIYDKVEVFRSGYVQIMKDDLIGLIDSTGTEILPPKYTKIDIVSNGFKTHLGKKVGFFKLGWKEVSPKYSRIYYDNGFISASGLNGYDIYTKEGLVLENQKQGFSKWSFKKDGGIIATKDDLFGIYSVDGWLLEPKYDKIVAFPCNDYSEVNYLGEVVEDLNFFYAGFNNLKDTDISYYSKSFNLDGKDQSVAFLKAGSFINLFGEISSFSYNDDRNGYDHNHVYEVVVNSEKISFSDNFKEIVPSINVSGYTITLSEDSNVISHPSYLTTYQAKRIEPFYVIEDGYDEWGYPILDSQRVLNNGYVTVYTDTSKFLFKLDGFNSVSPHLSLDAEIIVSKNNFANGENDVVFYFHQGTKIGMHSQEMKWNWLDLSYEDIEFINANLIKVRTGKEKKYIVISQNRIQDTIVEIDDAFSCKNWEEDDETYYEYDGFEPEFIILQDENKYGILNLNNEAIHPQFDTILPMEHENLVAVKREGKYGFVNLKTLHISEIAYNEIPDVIIRDDYHYLIREKGANEFKDQYGFRTLSEYETYISETEEGTDCIKTYNIFGEEETTYNPQNDEIQLSKAEAGDLYFKQEANGRVGAIDAFGNQILPSIYSKLGYDYYFVIINGLQEVFIKTFIKNKVGLATVRGKIIVPNEFSSISEFTNDYDVLGFLVQKRNKQGLYATDGSEILPCEYKLLEPASLYYDVNSEDIILTNKKGKMGLVDKTGAVKLPVEYDKLNYREKMVYKGDDYAESLMTIEKKGKLGLYDTKKGILIPAIYDEIEDYVIGDKGIGSSDFGDELEGYMVTKGGKYGVYSYAGKQLLPCEFKYINTSRKRYFDGKNIQLVTAKNNDKIYVSAFTYDDRIQMGYDDIGSFDHFSGWYGYTMLEDSTFLKTNIVTGTKENVGKTYIMEGGLFDIYMEDGKFGVKSKRGNVLIEPIYDKASFWEGNSEVMIGYENDIMYYIYPSTNERYTEAEW